MPRLRQLTPVRLKPGRSASSEGFVRVSSGRLNRLKARLQATLGREWTGLVPLALVHRAIEEAAGVAETTGLPHLFLPALAEEEVRRITAFALDSDGNG